ncbi:hypothetical protein POM88_036122 [Heracleum sosnowskyi]|uniref:Uncharacterized protein n=1 Tax=Heracleum sosnowskyi TaxID=360622 RepID=A0AAD8HPW8_9APIA|nr:hypothetical protein POM88_036122 [Heracleum sosnowskyi]
MNGLHSVGNPWYIPTMKLKNVKQALIALSRNSGLVGKRVQHAKTALLSFQSSIYVPHSIEDYETEKRLISEFKVALDHEESLLKQISHINYWMKTEDINSKLFHNYCKGLWNTNKKNFCDMIKIPLQAVQIWWLQWLVIILKHFWVLHMI